MDEYTYLNKIDSPADLKKLSKAELPQICHELRDFIIRSLSQNPGHLASSLGTVELTVALHYVFDTPTDQLIWDVGHQAYGHKILTGRRDRFHTNRQFKGIAPFPNPNESEYDAFPAGHASNSISAALGIAVAHPEQNVVAVIGDGAMTGGLAFEGLNNASMVSNNLLIILNDNNMAIDPIHGGITQYLVDITTSERYNRLRWKTYRVLEKMNLMSDSRKNKIKRFSTNLKTILTHQSQNIFQGLNLRYFGPADGHDVESLVRILTEIKNHQGPKVLHIITTKGKGYAPAENDQTTWHAPGEFNVETGERKQGKKAKLWQEVFGETLLEMARENEKIVGVTPAMPSGCSMNIMQREIPERVFDCGIAEGHAVTFSAGLAKGGMIPFCNIYSSFLQRAYDNIIHDVTLCQLPVVLCIDRAGIVGNDGATHHGLFDLAYLSPIPHLIIGVPRTGEDLRQMMHMAPELKCPVAIRYPRGKVDEEPACSVPCRVGKGVQLRSGKDLAVVALGPIANTAAAAIDELAARPNDSEKRSIALWDMRWMKPIDTEILDYIGQNYPTVVTLEDGVIHGGLGSAVSEYMAEKGYPCRVIRHGVNDRYVEHGSTAELYHMLKMDKEGICELLLQVPEK